MYRPLLVALALAALALPALAEDPPPAPASAPAGTVLPLTGKTLKTEGIDWHARAEKWFDAADQKARKEQMRTVTKALKQGCKYCHTADFEGYTEKKLVAQQMMALSKEHGVACADCHAGKDRFTHLGEEAHEMWALSVEKGVTCDHCHKPGTRFEGLTAEGEKFEAESKKPVKP
jgi:nitrate/TMAO reductase-like tetraheme cytochrome c subunit